MIKTEGGCTCACTYSMFSVVSLYGEKPAMKREMRAMRIPVWAVNRLGEAGCPAPCNPPYAAAHLPSIHQSPRPPARSGTPGPSPPHLVLEKPCLPGDGDKDHAPQSASGSLCPGVTAAPCASARGQRGSSINEAFNDDYWLVLQASESHLNSGNFKLFWQYKRA